MSQKGLSLFKSFEMGGVGRDGKEFILSKDNKLSLFVIAPFDEYVGEWMDRTVGVSFCSPQVTHGPNDSSVFSAPLGLASMG